MSITSKRKLIINLIDDIPVTSGHAAFARLGKCLTGLIQSTQVPTVISLTHYHNSESNDTAMWNSEDLESLLHGSGAHKVKRTKCWQILWWWLHTFFYRLFLIGHHRFLADCFQSGNHKFYQESSYSNMQRRKIWCTWRTTASNSNIQWRWHQTCNNVSSILLSLSKKA